MKRLCLWLHNSREQDIPSKADVVYRAINRSRHDKLQKALAPIILVKDLVVQMQEHEEPTLPLGDLLRYVHQMCR